MQPQRKESLQSNGSLTTTKTRNVPKKYNTRVTSAEITEMRQMRMRGDFYREISEYMGISISVIKDYAADIKLTPAQIARNKLRKQNGKPTFSHEHAWRLWKYNEMTFQAIAQHFSKHPDTVRNACWKIERQNETKKLSRDDRSSTSGSKCVAECGADSST